jgi:hypothetical protein
MIERDKFAFAALGCIMNSDVDSEEVIDYAKKHDLPTQDCFAEAAYRIGDAMLREGSK